MREDRLKQLVIDTLEDLKAREIRVLDVRPLTTITDYMVIATGQTDRHVKAIAQQVAEQAKDAGTPPTGVEGEQGGEWIIVDLLDVLVHVMQPKTRDFYQLEKLWTADSAPQPETEPESAEVVAAPTLRVVH